VSAVRATLETSVVRVRGGRATEARDRLAIERPLEIRTDVGGTERVLSTTMRTPGEDLALAVGFLHAEGVVTGADDVRGIEQVAEDVVRVVLAESAAAAVAASERSFVTSSACGVCGRTSLEGMASGARARVPDQPRVDAAVIHRLPGALREAQPAFGHTGGLHAAGLFSPEGETRAVHEDVGRHNAVDKLVGTLLLARQLPANDGVLVVSGRASFELVQKADAAGIPVLAAVGAPSSAAVERAAAAGMTLLGFVRDGGFNLYTGRNRIMGLPFER
jgi:FdhD protein